MRSILRILVAVAWLAPIVTMLGCGNYEINTFHFVPAAKAVEAKTKNSPVPTIWIDTNTRLNGLIGGTLESHLPCAVMIDFTDVDRQFKELVVTTVEITYEDEKDEPSTRSLKLPVKVAGRSYESTNSIDGGAIETTKAWIFSGKLPDLITRDHPLRLRLKGHFTKRDNSKIDFAIDRQFKIERDHGTRPANEVLQDK